MSKKTRQEKTKTRLPKEIYIKCFNTTDDLDQEQLFEGREDLEEMIGSVDNNTRFAVYKLVRVEILKNNPRLEIEQEFE